MELSRSIYTGLKFDCFSIVSYLQLCRCVRVPLLAYAAPRMSFTSTEIWDCHYDVEERVWIDANINHIQFSPPGNLRIRSDVAHYVPQIDGDW